MHVYLGLLKDGTAGVRPRHLTTPSRQGYVRLVRPALYATLTFWKKCPEPTLIFDTFYIPKTGHNQKHACTLRHTGAALTICDILAVGYYLQPFEASQLQMRTAQPRFPPQ